MIYGLYRKGGWRLRWEQKQSSRSFMMSEIFYATFCGPATSAPPLSLFNNGRQ